MCARVLLLSLLLAASSVSGPPAPAHLGSHDVTFTAGMPCSFACPHWLSSFNHDVDGDGQDDLYFDECAAPAPWAKGTAYDELLTEPIPEGADLLRFDAAPTVDFDIFICEFDDTWDDDGRPQETLASGSSYHSCDSPHPDFPIPFGCKESAQINAKPGRQILLRAYNWSDIAILHGTYTFKKV